MAPKDSNTSYIFDPENRISSTSGFIYTYDAGGNRVVKTNADTTPATGTLYWYMSSGIMAESDLLGNLQSEYVFFDGERMARKIFSATLFSYYFSDHLKTASVITDAAGNLKSESDYYPWGGELQFTNVDNNGNVNQKNRFVRVKLHSDDHTTKSQNREAVIRLTCRLGGRSVKWFFGVLSLVVATGSLYSAHDFRSRYPVVESYEIRPGVLMTPKYADDGDVCEMIIEKRHVQGQTVDFSSSMPREFVLKVIDELAPAAERGKTIMPHGGFDYVTNVSGLASTSNADYENVAIEIHSDRSSSDYGDVAVLLRWKKNKCAPSATHKPLP